MISRDSLGPFYVTGGTLKPGAPSYVERSADADLFDYLLAGEFCHVLTSRQTGKSSLMARTAKLLEMATFAPVIVDLAQIRTSEDQAASQWYFGIANQACRYLNIPALLRPWWQSHSHIGPALRLTRFFREFVLTHCASRVIIFFDEIDSTIGLPFRGDFFGALRACWDARAANTDFERLAFVMLGVAMPDQLIQDSTNSPFNIGKSINLSDFSRKQAQRLALGLHPNPGEADQRLERILYWTCGHPYLTQVLCRAIHESNETGEPERVVDLHAKELFLTPRAQREETNFQNARTRLERPGLEGRQLLSLYFRICQGEIVPDDMDSPHIAQLKLAGVVKSTEEGYLTVRNRIYQEVLTTEWIEKVLPHSLSP